MNQFSTFIKRLTSLNKFVWNVVRFMSVTQYSWERLVDELTNSNIRLAGERTADGRVELVNGVHRVFVFLQIHGCSDIVGAYAYKHALVDYFFITFIVTVDSMAFSSSRMLFTAVVITAVYHSKPKSTEWDIALDLVCLSISTGLRYRFWIDHVQV